jgi:hypothetical protein
MVNWIFWCELFRWSRSPSACLFPVARWRKYLSRNGTSRGAYGPPGQSHLLEDLHEEVGDARIQWWTHSHAFNLFIELEMETKLWGRQDMEEELQNILRKLSTFRYVLPRLRVTFNWLHVAASQQMAFFTIAAVRISNPKKNSFHICHSNFATFRIISWKFRPHLMLDLWIHSRHQKKQQEFWITKQRTNHTAYIWNRNG